MLTMGISLSIIGILKYFSNLIDTYLISPFGIEAISAVSLSGLVISMVISFLLGINVPSHSFFSKELARTKESLGGDAVSSLSTHLFHMTLIGFILGLFSFMTISGLSHYISALIFTGISGYEARQGFDSYLQIAKYSILMMPVIFVYFAYLATIGQTKIIITLSIISTGIKICSTWILINGLTYINVPSLKIQGAALGTILSEICLVGYILWNLMKGNALVFSLILFKKYLEKAVIMTFWPGIQAFISILILLIFRNLVGQMGIVYLAFTSVTLQVITMNRIILFGFVRSNAISFTNALNAQELGTAKEHFQKGSLLCIGGSIVCNLILCFFVQSILAAFSLSPSKDFNMVSWFILFALFSILELAAFNYETIAKLNGAEVFVSISEIILQFCVLLIGSYCFGILLQFGAISMWSCYLSLQIILVVVMYAQAKRVLQSHIQEINS